MIMCLSMCRMTLMLKQSSENGWEKKFSMVQSFLALVAPFLPLLDRHLFMPQCISESALTFSKRKLEICHWSLRKGQNRWRGTQSGKLYRRMWEKVGSFGLLFFLSVRIFFLFFLLLSFGLPTCWPFGSTYLFLHLLDYTIIAHDYSWFLTSSWLAERISSHTEGC